MMERSLSLEKMVKMHIGYICTVLLNPLVPLEVQVTLVKLERRVILETMVKLACGTTSAATTYATFSN